MGKPKILFWDVETSYKISAHFGSYGVDIPHGNTLLNTYMICAAWRWDNEKRIRSVSVLDNKKIFSSFNFDVRNLVFNDYHVIKTLHDVISEADILVHHNGDKFDLKKFTARCIAHGLDPIPHKMTIDTLKATKQVASFDSHALDALCHELELNTKMKTSPGLWLDATLGDVNQIKKMVAYCKKDIPPLSDLYYKIRPYMKTHPNMGLFGCESGLTCPKCGSNQYRMRGTYKSGVSIKRRYKCMDMHCGAWFIGKKSTFIADTR